VNGVDTGKISKVLTIPFFIRYSQCITVTASLQWRMSKLSPSFLPINPRAGARDALFGLQRLARRLNLSKFGAIFDKHCQILLLNNPSI
jgi:hypothetical protein